MVATHRIIKGVSVLLKVLVVLAVVALLIPLILYTYPQALIAIILENNCMWSAQSKIFSFQTTRTKAPIRGTTACPGSTSTSRAAPP